MLVDALHGLANDLVFLDQWRGDMEPARLACFSRVLRRLTLQGDYELAWRAIGKKRVPTLVAVDLPKLIPGFPSAGIQFALARGICLGGRRLETVCIARDGCRPDTSCAASNSAGFPGEKRYSLTAFLASPAGVVDGEVFTRRDVIGYVASRKDAHHRLHDDFQPYFRRHERLAWMEDRLSTIQPMAMQTELFAIARVLADSDDARVFVDAVFGRTGQSVTDS